MLKNLNEKWKTARNFLGGGVALVTVGTIGGALYVLERDGDGFARDIDRLESAKINQFEIDIKALEGNMKTLEARFHQLESTCITRPHERSEQLVIRIRG